MNPKQFWKFRNAVESNGTELILEGTIASESWWGDEVTPQEFRDELKKHTGSTLTVVINSGGGDVFAGLSIYNALRELDAEVIIRVDGLAASIASIIAMAGNKVIMSPGSLMMIHRPSVFAAGNVDDLDKARDLLLKIEESITPIYTEKTGLSTEKIAEMLEAETWMSADEAVELGFADQVIKSEQASLKSTIQNALNGNFAYSMEATKQSLASFAEKVTESTKEGDNVVEPSEAQESVATATADATEEATEETIKTEEVDENTEVVEPVVSQPTNSTEKDIKMTEQEKIAAAQVIAPSAQATPEVKPTMQDYLKKPAAMEAFARVLEENAGRTSDDVKAAWKQHLEVTMGVTNPEIFLPEALISEIEDAFKAGGEIWNRVSKTGSDVFRAAWDTEDDMDSEDGRGRGYNRSVEDEKAEQVLTIADRVLRPQFIYKYITLNKEDVKNQRSTGALVRYVLSELPRRIIREVERAIVIGDGRASGSAYKISSFVAIKADATAGNVFASTYTPAAGESRYASMLKARDLLEADGAVVLVAKKGYLTDVLLEENATGGFLFAPGTNLSAVLRFDAIIEPDWMDQDTDNDAYLVTFSNYKTVGDSSIESFTNFILKTNKQEYLQEIWAGGALTVRKSAVAIAAATS
jgi:ATP-dependent Clp endopeptidase proteolytic subunit ClpP